MTEIKYKIRGESLAGMVRKDLRVKAISRGWRECRIPRWRTRPSVLVGYNSEYGFSAVIRVRDDAEGGWVCSDNQGDSVEGDWIKVVAWLKAKIK